MDTSDEAKIGQMIDVQPDGCWLFRGRTNQYGRAWVGGRSVLVHRFVYETLVEPIPSSYSLHHECEMPSCCNPEHLTALHPRQHMAEHTLRRMTVNPRDARSVLRWIEQMDKRDGRVS